MAEGSYGLAKDRKVHSKLVNHSSMDWGFPVRDTEWAFLANYLWSERVGVGRFPFPRSTACQLRAQYHAFIVVHLWLSKKKCTDVEQNGIFDGNGMKLFYSSFLTSLGRFNNYFPRSCSVNATNKFIHAVTKRVGTWDRNQVARHAWIVELDKLK